MLNSNPVFQYSLSTKYIVSCRLTCRIYFSFKQPNLPRLVGKFVNLH
jgi:hypothetical protein